MLVRLGVRPVVAEVPRDEYLDAMNHYIINRRDVGPLLDMFTRLISDQLAES